MSNVYDVYEVELAIEQLIESDDWYYGEDAYLTIKGEPVPAKCVETTGGMDEGSSASATYQIGDQFFTKEGYYASHYGYDWDGSFYESTPTPVTTTVYKRRTA